MPASGQGKQAELVQQQQSRTAALPGQSFELLASLTACCDPTMSYDNGTSVHAVL